MRIDLLATIANVRKANPQFEYESESQYESRTLHLTMLLIEHDPNNAVFEPVEPEQEQEENEEAQ